MLMTRFNPHIKTLIKSWVVFNFSWQQVGHRQNHRNSTASERETLLTSPWQTGCNRVVDAQPFKLNSHEGWLTCLCVRVCTSAYVSVSHVASVKLRDADGREEAAATPKWKLKYLITWVLLLLSLFTFYKHLPAMRWLALWDLFAKWKIYLHLESA